MVYGYIRVSTSHQNMENQQLEIEKFARLNGIHIDEWIEEKISGTKKPESRKLGRVLMQHAKEGDIIICTEISRFGRSLIMIMNVLQYFLERDIKVWTIKDNYRLGDDIQSKVLAFAFGLSAEIERQLISQRTKEALALRKKNGKKLGRPLGSFGNKSKLDGAELAFSVMIFAGTSVNQIAKLYGAHRNTVKRFIERHKLDSTESMERVRNLG